MENNINMSINMFNEDSPFYKLSFKEQKELIEKALHDFCNRGLASGIYNCKELYLYDAIFGGMIRRWENANAHRDSSNEDYMNFFKRFEYHGYMYRILVPVIMPVNDNGSTNNHSYKHCLPEIEWHGLIASWTKKYDFTEDFNHIIPDEKCTIIELYIDDSTVGIDVNELRRVLGIENYYLAKEQEIIFPMLKNENCKIYKNITPLEFKELIEKNRG